MIRMSLAEAARSTGAEHGELSGYFRGCGTDTRQLRRGELFFALRGPCHNGHCFLAEASAAGAAGAVVERSPAASVPLLRVPDSRAALGILAAHWRQRFRLPLVAVTGSNGKTTVKEMLAAVLRPLAPVLATHGNLNNDIGVPLTMFGLGPEHRYAVLELGANRPGDIALLSRWTKPQVVIITQCAPAHLEGFGGLEGVAAAKAEIFEGLAEDGIAVLNADDAFADYWRRRAPGRVLCFGLDPAAEVGARDWRALPRAAGTEFLLRLPGFERRVRLSLCGRHNLCNALAAAAAAHALGIPGPEITRGLESCRPPPGRLQALPGPRGSLILDDSYNANPGSLQAALEVLADCPGQRWLVLGDMLELGPDTVRLHEQAGRAARTSGVQRLYCVGELAAHAAGTFGTGAACFKEPAAAAPVLGAALSAETHVLVKGSRMTRMEHLLRALSATEE